MIVDFEIGDETAMCLAGAIKSAINQQEARMKGADALVIPDSKGEVTKLSERSIAYFKAESARARACIEELETAHVIFMQAFWTQRKQAK